MKAMILAAGGATHLYPLTYTLPMVMVPVVNTPVIEHLVRLLARHGFDQIVVNLHYLHRTITGYLGDGSQWGVSIRYSHEDALCGTAGGVKRVSEFFDDTFLVIGGDDLTDIDLTSMLEFHRKHQGLATMAVLSEADAQEVGIAALDDDQRVVQFEEKPKVKPEKSSWVNTGIYLFEPAIFDHIPDVVPYDFGKHLFPELVAQNQSLYGYPAEGFWVDVEDPSRYVRAHREILHGRTGIEIPGDEVSPQVWQHPSAEVSPQAILSPPLVIGPGVRIEAGVRVEGPVVLGPEVVLEKNSRVKGSILWDHTHVGADTSVSDSLVGSSCVLPGGRDYDNVLLASGARFFEKKVSLD